MNPARFTLALILTLGVCGCGTVQPNRVARTPTGQAMEVEDSIRLVIGRGEFIWTTGGALFEVSLGNLVQTSLWLPSNRLKVLRFGNTSELVRLVNMDSYFDRQPFQLPIYAKPLPVLKTHLLSNSKNGELLTTPEGSWEVLSIDSLYTYVWLPSTEVLLVETTMGDYPCKLLNTGHRNFARVRKAASSKE